MPKERSKPNRNHIRKRNQMTKKLQPKLPDYIKEEYIADEAYIKTEPVDNGYENVPMEIEAPNTVILNGNAENMASFENEIGLVSQLEFIKEEVDVDEATINEFRDEVKRISIDTATRQSVEKKKMKVIKKKKEKKEVTEEQQNETKKEMKKKKQEKKEKKKSIKSDEKQNASKSVEPLDILVDGKKMVKCPFCDKVNTTRNRSLMKEHIRFHTGETPYACSYCDRRFPLYATLQSHVQSFHKKKPLKCPLCRMNFYEPDLFQAHELKCVKRRTFECHLCHLPMKRLYMHKVRDHMRRAHTGECVFSCDYCPEKFVTKSSLFGHMQRHPDVMPYKCSVCNRRFREKEPFQKHEKHCLSRRRLECYLCEYTYPKLTVEGLVMHMRKHTGEKPFQCEFCKKYYPRPEALMQHLQRHRDLFNFKCARCHRRFATDTELKEHEKKCRKRRYECYICRFTEFGMSFSKFRRHMAAHTGDKWIRCHGCTETFSTSVGLAHHVSVQHPQLNSTICQICCRRFTNKKDRDAHQMKCLKRRVECYICKRGSATIKKLNTHMSIKHSGAQKFQCKLCARKFQLKNNLRIHIKSHTKVGLVNCQYCNQRFSDIKYKKKHEFRCKQSFECYLCKKSFPAFAILYGVHMRTHLGKRPYHCKHCTKTFVSIRTYNLHVIGQHLHLYKFKCNICDGIIQKNKDVIAHRRSCMKPIRQSQNTIFFQCSLCDEGLPRIPELRNHILAGKCKKHPKKVR